MKGVKHMVRGLTPAARRAFKRAVCHARRQYPSHDPRRVTSMRNYFGQELQRITSP